MWVEDFNPKAGEAENGKFRLEVVSSAGAQLGSEYEALKPEFEFSRVGAEFWQKSAYAEESYTNVV